jgi:hypothetical protein
MAAAAVADDVFGPGEELPHVDFLRRMAEIEAAYDADDVDRASRSATVVDFASARTRLRG